MTDEEKLLLLKLITVFEIHDDMQKEAATLKKIIASYNKLLEFVKKITLFDFLNDPIMHSQDAKKLLKEIGETEWQMKQMHGE